MLSATAGRMTELIVISDLHLGRGRNPETGRFHRLEAFFYDDDLRSFCAWLAEDAHTRGATLRLVLNGDTLDFLRSERPHEPPAALARAILDGHPQVVEALASLLARGHEVVFLPGNHDLELQQADVQGVVRAAIGSRLDPGDGAALARLRFEPWFVHEPGRAWIEHGSQYDRQGAFRFLLRGPSAVDEGERDLPLGNFFQRHVYNALGALTFTVPSTEAKPDYVRWLTFHQPRALVRVLAQQLPLALRLLRRVAHAAKGAPPALATRHRSELEALAGTSGLGERLLAIDGLKRVGELADVARRATLRLARTLALGLLVAGLALGTWSLGNHLVGALDIGVGAKAGLAFALAVVVLVFWTLALVLFLVRSPGRPRPTLAASAARIAAIAEVPNVVFGHTHQETTTRLGTSAWYFNTGTWLAVFLGDAPAPRERVQCTFVRIAGATAELSRWCPDRGRALPAIVLDP